MKNNKPTSEFTAAQVMEKLLLEHKVIDLSVMTAPDLPCTPVEGVRFGKSLMNWYTWPTGAHLEHVLVHDDHTGTHCDSPSHMVAPLKEELPISSEYGTITIEQVALEQLMGPAAVIDVRHLLDGAPPGEKTIFAYSPEITVKDVQDWEEQHGDLRPGEVVLFYTSWSDLYYRRYPEGFKFDRSHPAPTPETIEYLADRGIKHVGLDTHGLGQLQDDYPTHRAAFRRGMVATEKLTNLGKLPPRGAYFIFLPHKIEGVSGGLGRAIAIV